MKFSIPFLSLCIFSFLLIYSCSTDEEETVVPVVQTPEPEPKPVEYTLTVSAAEGGTVSTEGGTYDEGTEVTITASANEGYRFTGWEGNSSTNESLTITVNSNQNIQANFEELFPIYLGENGVTVKAYDFASVGIEYELDGVNYLVVDNSTILTQIELGNVNLCTSFVTNMDELFEDNNSENLFNSDISFWDTSNVTSMVNMFYGAEVFNIDISFWNTAKVTNMQSMFLGAITFNQDIGNWDTSGVTNMDSMFWNTPSFNQDLTGWCVSNFPSEPTNFAATPSALEEGNKPVWGTCPE